MKSKFFVMCLVFFALGFTGCVKTVSDTGKTQYSIDPNKAVQIQAGLDTAAGTATTAGVFWPELAGLGIVIGWVAGLFRKLNPVLAKARDSEEIRTVVLSGVTKAIEAMNIGDKTTVTDTIKEKVAEYLNANGIAEEGKAIITEAKNL